MKYSTQIKAAANIADIEKRMQECRIRASCLEFDCLRRREQFRDEHENLSCQLADLKELLVELGGAG